MPLDPLAKAWLDQWRASEKTPLDARPLEEARAALESLPRNPGPELARVADQRIPGPAGELTLRVYTPGASAPYPALVWFHSGGWVFGSIETADATCRLLAKAAECLVVSVGFRLAPEAKFPAPLEDCHAALRWVAENAAALGADARRIAVGGTCSGGNLAAGVALMARDRGGPALALQLLAHTEVDPAPDTLSYAEYGTDYGLTREAMSWYWRQYLRNEDDANNPYAAPLRARDLSNLPPALVITAEYDPVRDEAEAYAQRLVEAGVPAACTRYQGTVHGFFDMAFPLDKTEQAFAEAASALREAFGR